MARDSAHTKKGTNTRRLTTAARQKLFLAKFEDCANISKATKAAGVGRRTFYDWCQHDPEFKAKFDEAGAVALTFLEDEATRRATEGTLKPVYQKGELVGKIREYSDTLLIVLLKARAPEKYKERHQVDSTNRNLNIDGSDLTDEQLDQKIKQLQSASEQ